MLFPLNNKKIVGVSFDKPLKHHHCNIGAQQLSQYIGAYLVKDVVMIRELFKVCDAYERNEIYLTKDVTQFKDRLKVQTDKVEELNI